MFPEDMDPWNFIALPIVWVVVLALTVRDFISDRLRSKT